MPNGMQDRYPFPILARYQFTKHSLQNSQINQATPTNNVFPSFLHLVLNSDGFNGGQYHGLSLPCI